jgi:hypothetical protein
MEGGRDEVYFYGACDRWGKDWGRWGEVLMKKKKNAHIK